MMDWVVMKYVFPFNDISLIVYLSYTAKSFCQPVVQVLLLCKQVCIDPFRCQWYGHIKPTDNCITIQFLPSVCTSSFLEPNVVLSTLLLHPEFTWFRSGCPIRLPPGFIGSSAIMLCAYYKTCAIISAFRCTIYCGLYRCCSVVLRRVRWLDIQIKRCVTLGFKFQRLPGKKRFFCIFIDVTGLREHTAQQDRQHLKNWRSVPCTRIIIEGLRHRLGC